MGKFIKRKEMTPEQYKRSNKVMLIILTLCYLMYSLTEIWGIGDAGLQTGQIVRFVVYATIIVANILMLKFQGDKKLCMLFYSVTYLIAFSIMALGNAITNMILVLPVILGFMLYLNSLMVGLGCIATIIIAVIKLMEAFASGNQADATHAQLIVISLIMVLYASYRAIALLVDFNKEDQEVIAEEARHRQKVAEQVAVIVDDLDVKFHNIVDNIGNISQAMGASSDAMNNISESSESTAEAIGHQAEMTGQIQSRLENANLLATNAGATSDHLASAVTEGKEMADHLQTQSELVANHMRTISETVNHLVANVQQVAGITDSILQISSQTNLLALNASIEAARAGDAGRGFAVVADQIRSLAAETKLSTEKITAIIDTLTAVTTETQTGIEESASIIENQRKQVNEVASIFAKFEQDMVALAKDMNVMTEEVSSVLNANNEIVDSVSVLSATSEEVTSSAISTCETIQSANDTLTEFSGQVNNAFDQLQELKQNAAM